jgi:hypothetical protein
MPSPPLTPGSITALIIVEPDTIRSAFGSSVSGSPHRTPSRDRW